MKRFLAGIVLVLFLPVIVSAQGGWLTANYIPYQGPGMGSRCEASTAYPGRYLCKSFWHMVNYSGETIVFEDFQISWGDDDGILTTCHIDNSYPYWVLNDACTMIGTASAEATINQPIYHGRQALVWVEIDNMPSIDSYTTILLDDYNPSEPPPTSTPTATPTPTSTPTPTVTPTSTETPTPTITPTPLPTVTGTPEEWNTIGIQSHVQPTFEAGSPFTIEAWDIPTPPPGQVELLSFNWGVTELNFVGSFVATFFKLIEQRPEIFVLFVAMGALIVIKFIFRFVTDAPGGGSSINITGALDIAGDTDTGALPEDFDDRAAKRLIRRLR